MSKALEALKTEVKDLLQKQGFKIYDQPSVANISIGPSPVTNWYVRMGDPATEQDFWVDAQSEHHMWLNALAEIKKYIAEKSAGSP